MKAPTLVLMIPLAMLAACGRSEAPVAPATPAVTPAPDPSSQATTAAVTLAGASGSQVAGELTLTTGTGGVSLAGEITGLPAGSEHGIHFHEKGDCSAPDASSAGEHFNPSGQPHGGPTAEMRHLGDLPNLRADDRGHATYSAVIAAATLRDGSPADLVGKALIVHAKADDYTTQPSGNSGDRIACGVVR